MSFSQLPDLEKDTKNGAPGNFLGPSYFETALVITIFIETPLLLILWLNRSLLIKIASKNRKKIHDRELSLK